ncbi:MAG: 2-C-methyl-D-erythritol 4-phosphate cytidylyltransferase [Sulfobacillus thermosulfidooxidans]|uniref:2-C-methyl-D-erythritol 4-phosphate cytidylyltransferase n=1 Tax=Sulfobacillus thermosulfidooxidans TaxID=28034 RepID=A0A2T2WT01_SULTH|nr:MAG: 2-C-methyl-D-erythritol 4-phosphate cytidylyltransferase [Sulfobacillus thermosulfidooxidans]
MKSFGILLAAGQSRRMGALGPKLWLMVAGRPAFAWSLWHFAVKGEFDGGVVVARPEDFERIEHWFNQFGLTHWRLTTGSTERYLSVQQGLAALKGLAQDQDVVLIHDAARILVPFAVIDRVRHAAFQQGAAMPALPVTDTVKGVVETPSGVEVIKTIPRSQLRLAQTPQGFHYRMIRQAHEAWQQGVPTDDAEVVEHFGHRVMVVPGDYDNRKLTTPDDLTWFEWRLQQIHD